MRVFLYSFLFCHLILLFHKIYFESKMWEMYATFCFLWEIALTPLHVILVNLLIITLFSLLRMYSMFWAGQSEYSTPLSAATDRRSNSIRDKQCPFRNLESNKE